MKTRLAILRELRRVKKALNSNSAPPIDHHALYGAQQALAWALDQNAMAPAKTFRPTKGR